MRHHAGGLIHGNGRGDRDLLGHPLLILWGPGTQPDFLPDSPAPRRDIWATSGVAVPPRMLRGR